MAQALLCLLILKKAETDVDTRSRDFGYIINMSMSFLCLLILKKAETDVDTRSRDFGYIIYMPNSLRRSRCTCLSFFLEFGFAFC